MFFSTTNNFHFPKYFSNNIVYLGWKFVSRWICIHDNLLFVKCVHGKTVILKPGLFRTWIYWSSRRVISAWDCIFVKVLSSTYIKVIQCDTFTNKQKNTLKLLQVHENSTDEIEPVNKDMRRWFMHWKRSRALHRTDIQKILLLSFSRYIGVGPLFMLIFFQASWILLNPQLL